MGEAAELSERQWSHACSHPDAAYRWAVRRLDAGVDRGLANTADAAVIMRVHAAKVVSEFCAPHEFAGDGSGDRERQSRSTTSRYLLCSGLLLLRQAGSHPGRRAGSSLTVGEAVDCGMREGWRAGGRQMSVTGRQLASASCPAAAASGSN